MDETVLYGARVRRFDGAKVGSDGAEVRSDGPKVLRVKCDS